MTWPCWLPVRTFGVGSLVSLRGFASFGAVLAVRPLAVRVSLPTPLRCELFVRAMKMRALRQD